MEKNVLLIDDEASLRRSVAMGLMQKGYQTEPCENGMKGLQTLATFKQKHMALGCAVVDVRLPDIDGLKLLKVIKLNYPQVPVIIITGHGSEAIAEEAKAADGYLEKPFDMDELAKLLEELEPKAAKTGEQPREETKKNESVTMYAMVTLDNTANLVETYRKLYFHQNVLYCDAIRGDYDLVLMLQAATFDEINELVEKELKTMRGVADITLMPVQTPVFPDNVVNIIGSVDHALGRDETEATQLARQRVSSYVMLEIEKEKIEAIYPALYFNDHVVNCDCTEGTYNIVLLVKGTSFTDIEQTVRNKFKALDGVLKIKQFPIVTLFEA
ncbi:MAG: response regulator [Syntrophorhabdales bacterium]|jgi:DNA-binding response OmpR family regulator